MKRWRYLIAAAVAAGSMAAGLSLFRHSATIQTDSTLWYGSVKGATGNGKYGLIDTTGQYVSRNDFDQIEWRDSRYMGKRGGRESVVESPWSTLTIYNNEGLLSVIISN